MAAVLTYIMLPAKPHISKRMWVTFHIFLKMFILRYIAFFILKLHISNIKVWGNHILECQDIRDM
jgi:hypothetical protein